MSEEKKKRSRWWRLGGTGLAVVVIAVVFAFFLPKIASYASVWDVVKGFSWQDFALLGGATVLNLATFAPPWMTALPGLRFRQAFVVTQSSTALTLIAPGGPVGGMAVSFGMLHRWGFKSSAVALAVAVTGVWNQFAILGFPVIALAFLTVTGGSNPLLETVALIGLGVFVVAVAGFAVGLRSDREAKWLGDRSAEISSRALRLVRRGPVTWGGRSFVRFRGETVGLLKRRWLPLTLATLAGHLTVFLVLLVSLRVTGVSSSEVTAIEAFAAWSIMRLVGSIPITPGGVGVIELGLTSLLVGFGGKNAEVVAAVLVYRALTVLPTLVLGAVSASTWKLHDPHRAST
jgi:putative heme transporter